VFIKYYGLTLIFYILEIFIFKYALDLWMYDIFWLNILIRVILVIVYAFIVRNLLFSAARNFYTKFSILILLNPLVSSTLLKILIVSGEEFDVILLKIFADLVTSILVYKILRKIV
jgi:hypothetical protein